MNKAKDQEAPNWLTEKDLWDMPREEEHFKSMYHIADNLAIVMRYYNGMIIHDDYSKGVKNVALSAYYQAVTPCLQLEHSLYLANVFNLEYSHALSVRSYIELVGRFHKGIRLYQQLVKSKDVTQFEEQCKRLVMAYKQGGSGGYNVLTLVESLDDKIPDILEKYGKLSEYIHGDLTYHTIYRKATYLTALAKKTSPIIEEHEKIIEKLIDIFLDDLEYVDKITEDIRNRQIKKESK